MGRYRSAFALLLHEATTTSVGNVGKTTLVDSSLIGRNDFLSDNNVIEIISGDARLESRGITTFDNVTGTITVDSAFSAQIISGIGYRVFTVKSSKTSTSVLESYHQVPAKDSTDDILIRDVVGKKEDTAQTTVGTTRSIIAYVKGLLNQVADVMGTGFVTADDSLHAISTEVSEILDLTRTGADISVSTAETNLYIDDAPTKIINGISIKIDTTDMGAGDTYEFREYYRIESAGSYIEIADTTTISDAQSDALYVIHLEPYRYGCKVTAKKTAGTDRAFPIEAIREA